MLQFNRLIYGKGLNMKVLLIILLVFIPCFADVYYVSQDADGTFEAGDNDNPGTEDQPWATVKYAAAQAEAGDTVLIKDGTYTEAVIVQNSGSEDNYIVFMNAPGHAPVLDGENTRLQNEGFFYILSKSYIVVSGLIIQNCTNGSEDVGVYICNSQHIIVEHNHIRHLTSSAIQSWYWDYRPNGQSKHIYIRHNEVEDANIGGPNEMITVSGTDTFEICYNNVHNGNDGSVGGEGIDVKQGASNGKIYGNHVWDIDYYRPGIYLDAWDDHTFNLELYGNVVHDIGHAGIYLGSERGGLLENIKVYNNIVYNNVTAGILLFGRNNQPFNNVEIYNNTFYNHNGETYWGGVCLSNPDATNITIRNNIVSHDDNNGGIVYNVRNQECEFTASNNLIQGPTLDTDDERIDAGDDFAGDPLFVDAENGNFYLLSGSPAIDAGYNMASEGITDDYQGTDRPVGSAYDIGAYEYDPEAIIKRAGPQIRDSKILSVTPVPSNSGIRFLVNSKQDGNLTLQVFNTSGQVCWRNDLSNANSQPVWRTGSTANGVYFIRTIQNNNTAVKRFVVRR